MLIVPPGSGIVHQVHSHVVSILGHVMQSCDVHIRSCDTHIRIFCDCYVTYQSVPRVYGF